MNSSDSPTKRYRDEVDRRAQAAHVPGSAPPVAGRASAWIEVAADTVGEALLQAWWVNGIDHVFFTSGSDIAWFQEVIPKLRAAGRPAPELVVMLHENASVNAACGFTAVADRPAATAAHVELGMLNYGDGVHTASRAQLPVMISSGQTPSAYAGTARGDRGQEPIWKQELADYGSILRQYVKWDHRLTSLENPGLAAGRALQLAMTGPRGPAYLSLPRDVVLTPLEGSRFPTAGQLGLPDPPAPDHDAVARAAALLVDADNPWLTSTVAGRDRRTPAVLVELAELLALPVRRSQRRAMGCRAPSRAVLDGGLPEQRMDDRHQRGAPPVPGWRGSAGRHHRGRCDGSAPGPRLAGPVDRSVGRGGLGPRAARGGAGGGRSGRP